MKYFFPSALLLTLSLTCCQQMQPDSPCQATPADVQAALSFGDPDINGSDVQEARCLVQRHGGLNGLAKEKMGSYSSYKVTPLAYAAAHGKTGVMKVLLAQGADMNIPTTEDQNVLGYTLLHWAASKCQVDAVRFLLSRGADAKAKDAKLRSVLLVAMGFGSPFEDIDRCEIAKMLIAHGADPNAGSDWNLVPLHWAASSDSPETVAFLLSKGANPNARDKNGFTPLYHAIHRSREAAPHIVRMLQQRGAHL